MNDKANSEDCYNLKKVQKCAESQRFSSIKLLCYVLKRHFILRHMNFHLNLRHMNFHLNIKEFNEEIQTDNSYKDEICAI